MIKAVSASVSVYLPTSLNGVGNIIVPSRVYQGGLFIVKRSLLGAGESRLQLWNFPACQDPVPLMCIDSTIALF